MAEPNQDASAGNVTHSSEASVKESLFWRLGHPVGIVVILPLLVLYLALGVIGRGSVGDLTTILEGIIGVMFAFCFYLARSSTKIDDSAADRNPLKYIRGTRNIKRLTYLRWLLILLLLPLLAFTKAGGNIYALGNPLLTLLMAFGVLYAVSLELVVTPFAIVRAKSFLLARIHLIAGLQYSTQLSDLLVGAISHFNNRYASVKGWRIKTDVCDAVATYSPNDQRVLALNLMPALNQAVVADDYNSFVTALARSQNKDYLEIIEPASIRYRVIKFFKDFGPLFTAIAAGAGVLSLMNELKLPMARRPQSGQ